MQTISSTLSNCEYAVVYRENLTFQRHVVCLVDVKEVTKSAGRLTNVQVSPDNVDSLPSEMIHRVTTDVLYSCLSAIDKVDKSELRIKRLHLDFEETCQPNRDHVDALEIKSEDQSIPIPSAQPHQYSAKNIHISVPVIPVISVPVCDSLGNAQRKLSHVDTLQWPTLTGVEFDSHETSVFPESIKPVIYVNQHHVTNEESNYNVDTMDSLRLGVENSDDIKPVELLSQSSAVQSQTSTGTETQQIPPFIQTNNPVIYVNSYITGISEDSCPVETQMFNSQPYLSSERISLSAQKSWNRTVVLTQKKKSIRQKKNKEQSKADKICPICTKEFSCKGAVANHMQTHSGEKPYQCDICGMAFSSLSTLKQHSSAIHTTEKLFKCTTCPSTFSCKAYLRAHLRRHNNVRPHACETCGKSFREKTELRMHIRVHTKEKPFKCQICGKGFRQSINRNKHFSRHEEQRQFWHKCEFCDKLFPVKEKFDIHRRIHTGEKPYLCDLCGKGFASCDYLAQHRKIHNETSYKCANCGRSYSWAHTLQQHMKTCLDNNQTK